MEFHPTIVSFAMLGLRPREGFSCERWLPVRFHQLEAIEGDWKAGGGEMENYLSYLLAVLGIARLVLALCLHSGGCFQPPTSEGIPRTNLIVPLQRPSSKLLRYQQQPGFLVLISPNFRFL